MRGALLQAQGVDLGGRVKIGRGLSLNPARDTAHGGSVTSAHCGSVRRSGSWRSKNCSNSDSEGGSNRRSRDRPDRSILCSPGKGGLQAVRVASLANGLGWRDGQYFLALVVDCKNLRRINQVRFIGSVGD